MSIRCCFLCAYSLYNSKIGRWLHNCVMRNRHERRIRSGLSLYHSWVDKEIFDFYSIKVKIVPDVNVKLPVIDEIDTVNKLIITTEKDAVRLTKFTEQLKDLPLYVLPIKHQFLFNEHKQFDKLIIDFIKSYAKLNMVNSNDYY